MIIISISDVGDDSWEREGRPGAGPDSLVRLGDLLRVGKLSRSHSRRNKYGLLYVCHGRLGRGIAGLVRPGWCSLTGIFLVVSLTTSVTCGTLVVMGASNKDGDR